MITALIGVIVFTSLIVILVVILNFAESKLLPQGEVSIEINQDTDKKLSPALDLHY